MFHCSTEVYWWNTLSFHQPPSLSATSPRWNGQLTEILWKCQMSVTLKESKIMFYDVILKYIYFLDSVFIMRKFHWKWRKSLFSMSVDYRSLNFIWLGSKLPFHIICSALEHVYFFFFFCIYCIEHLPTHQLVHQKMFSLAV